MKRVLYLNNYMLNDVINQRKNKEIFSQAANNKVNAIRKSLERNNVYVQILSSGLVNNKKLKFYKEFNSEIDKKLTYCSILDAPLLNIITSIFFMFFKIKKIHKNQKVSNIIFYNYKPEVAIPALLAKKLLKIPITLEYEDGYHTVDSIGKMKSVLFTLTEKIVSKNIDSAILVTSKLRQRVNVKNVVVRGVVDEILLIESSKKVKKNKKIKIIYSGGLDEERGIKILLESLKYIDYDFDLVITGKGIFENQVREYKDSRIKFYGFVDYDLVKKLIVNSDILINCQLEKHNFGEASFPSKIFEYIATGNRIVSSKVSDIYEFAKDCFYFYDDDKPENLALAIKKAINDIENNNNYYLENTKRICYENTYDSIGKIILKIL
ncbi:MAG: glycosyltransferase [Clostridium perfringens]|nr:glycosyltransferase [Clostridium perfringens]